MLVDNWYVVIIIIISTIACLLFFAFKNQLMMENFDTTDQRFVPLGNMANFKMEFDMYNTKIDGYNEGLPKVYNDLKTKYRYGVWRNNELMSSMWNTRLPSLVPQRYSYDDDRVYCEDLPALEEGARLKQLPMHLQNRWFAKVPIGWTEWNNAFMPANYLVNKRVPKCAVEQEKMFETRQTKIQGTPIDAPGAGPIHGYDPLDRLPENYADRSQTSIEYLFKENLAKDYMGSIHGWLPWEE